MKNRPIKWKSSVKPCGDLNIWASREDENGKIRTIRQILFEHQIDRKSVQDCIRKITINLMSMDEYENHVDSLMWGG